ncbi:hypothetical protein K440DRAFT_58530 [Wilcoxina mikolae CBS 423.85]|nr:hypothetical protein K440DRAFT_58530 [Wilcoxina mikolae CBS 423.85]
MRCWKLRPSCLRIATYLAALVLHGTGDSSALGWYVTVFISLYHVSPEPVYAVQFRSVWWCLQIEFRPGFRDASMFEPTESVHWLLPLQQ